MSSIPLDWPSRSQPSLRLLEEDPPLLRRRALPAAELTAPSELDSMVRRSCMGIAMASIKLTFVNGLADTNPTS
jgi:hypothetical protein